MPMPPGSTLCSILERTVLPGPTPLTLHTLRSAFTSAAVAGDTQTSCRTIYMVILPYLQNQIRALRATYLRALLP